MSQLQMFQEESDEVIRFTEEESYTEIQICHDEQGLSQVWGISEWYTQTHKPIQ